jgi:hypothetical protein
MSLIESSLSRSRSRLRATSKPSSSASFVQEGGGVLADEIPDLPRGHFQISRPSSLQSDEGLPIDVAMLPPDAGWLAGRRLSDLMYVVQGRRLARPARLEGGEVHVLQAPREAQAGHEDVIEPSGDRLAGEAQISRPQGLRDCSSWLSSSASSTLRQGSQRTDTQFRRLVRMPGLPQTSHVRMDSRSPCRARRPSPCRGADLTAVPIAEMHSQPSPTSP